MIPREPLQLFLTFGLPFLTVCLALLVNNAIARMTNRRIDDLSSSVNKRMDDLSGGVGKRMDDLAATMNRRMDDLAARFSAELRAAVAELRTDIRALDTKVDRIESSLLQTQADHEQRLSTLEDRDRTRQ